MIKKYFIALSLLFININLFSQKKINNYISYFENSREIPHLHLNKTSFLEGEKIWFQAYILEQNLGKLHSNTSNLYVSVFEESGKLKNQHLIRIKNGIGRGNILIDSTFTKNNYYLKASTNWMKNFKEDNSFYQKIKIISKINDGNKTTTLKEKDFFDFQLFPEGGHFLSNANNSIGILIKDVKNNGVEINRGLLKNSENKVIKTFTTNKFGIGKIDLFIKRGEFYTLEAELSNGSIIKKTIKKSRNIGVILKSIEEKESFKIIVETNTVTLNLLKEKTYSIFLHNTRNYREIQLNFNSTNKKYFFIINKNQLTKGINIITLFNENQKPISERLIFNNSSKLFTDVSLDKINISKDSVKFNITNNSSEKIYLSTSFLPRNTIAYNVNNNIKSSFLLEPYLRGKIENPMYYFDKKNKNRFKNLDLLLMTQGWSKFNWNSIFKGKPQTKYKFENGIDVKFTLNKKLSKKESLFIVSEENNFLRLLKDEQLPFTEKNMFIKKGSNFNLQRDKYSTKITPIISYSSGVITDVFNKKELTISDNNKYELSVFKDLNYNVLDEVIIVSKKTAPIEEINAISRSFKKINLDFASYAGETLRQILTSIIRKYKDTNYPVKKILINNINRISTDISSISKEQIREIRIGLFIFGLGREVHVYTYSDKDFKKVSTNKNKIKIPVGFSEEKEYYSPKYPSYVEETYVKYGAIFRESLISIDSNSSYSFKIPLNYQNGIKVFIEGISNSGKLLTKERNIKVNKEEM